MLRTRRLAHTLYIFSDDGAKVWMDGELVYDQWAPSYPGR